MASMPGRSTMELWNPFDRSAMLHETDVMRTRKKGKHIVRIMDVEAVLQLTKKPTVEERAKVGLDSVKTPIVCSVQSCYPYDNNTGEEHSVEESIDPEAIILRTLHCYMCSCGQRPRDCPDPATMIDNEVAEVHKMAGKRVEQEDDVIRNDLLPFIQHHDLITRRKRELLHRRWTKKVYEPIHKSVVGELRSRRHDDMITTRSLMFEAYLEHLNRKKNTFLEEAVDTPICYRYVEPHRLWLHARTRPLVDPLFVHSQLRRSEERYLSVYDGMDTNRPKLPPIDAKCHMSVTW